MKRSKAWLLKRKVEREKIMARRKAKRRARLEKLFPKNKGGRPPIKEGQKTKVISFSIPERDLAEFERDMAYLKLNASQFFRFLFDFWTSAAKVVKPQDVAKHGKEVDCII